MFRPGLVPQWPSSRGFTSGTWMLRLEQRVVEEVDLPDGQVVRRPPVRVDASELVIGERGPVDRLHDVSFGRPPADGRYGKRAVGV